MTLGIYIKYEAKANDNDSVHLLTYKNVCSQISCTNIRILFINRKSKAFRLIDHPANVMNVIKSSRTVISV